MGLWLPVAAQTTVHPANKDAVITVPVVVHNKRGDLVQNLTAADFTLTDNTHPQVIQSFAPNSNLPLKFGVLMETGAIQSSTLRDKERASEQFLNALLPASQTEEKTQAFVIQFNRDVDLLEDPSSSKDKMRQAMQQVGVAQFSGDSNAEVAMSESTATKKRQGKDSGAKLYDAIYLASTEVLARLDGRKAMVVLSDGIDRGSKTTLNGAVEAAQRAGVAVYAIYFKGGEPPMDFNRSNRRMGGGYPDSYPGSYPGGYPGGYPGRYPGGYPGGRAPAPSGGRRVDGRKMLADICEHTGGELFDSRKQKLSAIYAEITRQLDDAYILQYTRDKAATESGFHHIRLTPKQKAKDILVQMTEGYWMGQD